MSRGPRAWPIVVTVLMLAAASLAAQTVQEQDGPAVPWLLCRALQGRGRHIVARLDWQAVSSLPMVQRSLGLAPKEMPLQIVVIGCILRVARALGPISPRVDDVWIELDNALSDREESGWARTEMEPEAIRTALLNAGWAESARSRSVFVAPPDAGDRVYQEYLTMLSKRYPDGKIEEIPEVLKHKLSRLRIGHDGWLGLATPGAVVPTVEPIVPLTKDDGSSVVDFPFAPLLDMSRGELARVAIDTPSNEEHKESSPGHGHERETLAGLSERIKELRDRADLAVTSSIGDFSFVFGEVDGGLHVDVLARRPQGGDLEMSSRVVRLMTGLVALGTFYASPSLSRDLRAATFVEEKDELRGELVLGWAGLEDAVNAEVSRRRELKELEAKFETLAAAKEDSR